MARRGWCRHSISRGKLVRISGLLVQAGEEAEAQSGTGAWRGRRCGKNGLGTMWGAQTGRGRQLKEQLRAMEEAMAWRG